MADFFGAQNPFDSVTTWADEGPSGLSISRIPLRIIDMAGEISKEEKAEAIAQYWRLNLNFDLFQQCIDALGLILALIVGKFDGRDKAEIELFAEFRSDNTTGALETRKRFVTPLLRAEQVEK